jgi:excisionase family DNA binding protein
VSLLTLEQVTARFNTDVKTIYNWRKKEGLPYIKIGNQIFFREEALNAWLLKKETVEQ